ncbi:hypothetical protein PV458_36630 [Streptomyces sp. MN03-5084-2B]|nr:hypothetical protein [Streptomyces sp. MN03-5084-2B]
MLTELQPLERRTHPFAAAPPRDDVRGAHWVQPDLVGEIVYRQFTRAGRVRQHRLARPSRGQETRRRPRPSICPRARRGASRKTRSSQVSARGTGRPAHHGSSGQSTTHLVQRGQAALPRRLQQGRGDHSPD